MTEQLKNSLVDPTSTLGADITSEATSLTVASAAGYPADPKFRVKIGTELLLVTAVAGTTFTVTRAVEGTSAAAHTSGDSVELVVTKAALDQYLLELVTPGARVTKSANQTMTGGVEDLVTWDTESFDTDTMHDNATNNSRLTVQTAGLYFVTAAIERTSFGELYLALYKNGTKVGQTWFNGSTGSVTHSDLLSLAASDYLEMKAYGAAGWTLDKSHSYFAASRVSA